MERFYLYQGSLAVLGLSFLLNAGAPLAAGDWSLVPLLFAVSGSGLLLGAGYELLRTDPTEFTISAGALFIISSGACLSLILTVLDIVLSF